MLRQVAGVVGALTALTFVLTLEDPQRFAKSRTVGAYVSLVAGKDQSGEHKTPASGSAWKATRCSGGFW